MTWAVVEVIAVETEEAQAATAYVKKLPASSRKGEVRGDR
jgi:hypothetical protein